MTVDAKNVAGGLDKPKLLAPAGTCDCHMHVIYPETRFRFAPGKEASFPEHSPDAYRRVTHSLGIERCVVVPAPPYELDNASTMAAVQEIGIPARAVVNVGPSISEAELEALDSVGACGANFFMLPGGCLDWGDLRRVAEKVSALGWHVQVQLDGCDLAEREDLLSSLPTKIVIDHIGKFLCPADLDHPGFHALLRLVDRGKTYVKLSAFYETSADAPPYMNETGQHAAALIAAAPERMLWASNWPHLGIATLAEKPSNAMLLDTLLYWTEDPDIRNMILAYNPAKIYGFN